MKYLVLSDIHLNINRRFDDTVAVLEQVEFIAWEKGIDKILILGDTFTSRRPHSKELKAFEQFIHRITYKDHQWMNVPNVIILRGNHDEFPDGTHSYHAFEELGCPNVKIVTNPHIEDGIFMGHMLLREAKIGPTDYQLTDEMSTDELLVKYPDCKAYVLGDVHKHQVLKNEPLVMYSGSIEHVDFGERNDSKYVTILDIIDEVMPQPLPFPYDGWNKVGGSYIYYKFIPLKTRPMIQYDLYPPYVVEPTRPEGAIVKVIIHGTKEDVRVVDETRLRQALEGAKELAITYDIQKDSIARDKDMTESVAPRTALERYLLKLGLSPEEREEVLKLSTELMTNA